MKLGTRTYSEQEVVLIEQAKKQIKSLQSEIDTRYDALFKQVSARIQI